MNLLIATPQNSHFSVAVGQNKIDKLKTVKKPYRQSELLLKTIAALIKNQKITRIFVVRGPGAFSALRIGIATANALAYGWKVPVVGITLREEWNDLPEREKLNQVWQEGRKPRPRRMSGTRFVSPAYGAEPSITIKR